MWYSAPVTAQEEHGSAERTARARLLERAAKHVLERGLSDTSLRAIAAELGTSHRMLIYHFGSAEAFWNAVLDELRVHDVRALAQAVDTGRLLTLEETWAALSSDRYLSLMRLVFQVYGQALSDRERHAAFLEHVVDDWLQAITRIVRKQYGLGPAAAKRKARIVLAVMRGLLLDLLTTGDREGTTAALHDFARSARLLGDTK